MTYLQRHCLLLSEVLPDARQSILTHADNTSPERNSDRTRILGTMAGKLCSLSPLSETHPDKVQRLPVYPLETMDIKPTPHWYHPKPTSFPKVLKV